jgi:septum formation protein
MTALALYDAKNKVTFSGAEKSLVRFNQLDETSLKNYIRSGEPRDKAGAYGIQGMGRFLVDSVEGSIDNVVGLPMDELERLSDQFWKQYVG